MRDFTMDYREEDSGRIEANENDLMSRLNEKSDEAERVKFLQWYFDMDTCGRWNETTRSQDYSESDEVDTINIEISGRVSLDVSSLGMTIQDLLDKRITDEQRKELTSEIEELLSSQL